MKRKAKSSSALSKRILVTEFQYKNSLFEDLLKYVEENLWSSNEIWKAPKIALAILRDTQIRKKRSKVFKITEWDVRMSVKRIKYIHFKEEETK